MRDQEPCEKCRKPVYGYIAQYCCSGAGCGCYGLPVTPCWCEDCWKEWDIAAIKNALAFAKELDQ